jgi:hypothetical protein
MAANASAERAFCFMGLGKIFAILIFRRDYSIGAYDFVAPSGPSPPRAAMATQGCHGAEGIASAISRLDQAQLNLISGFEQKLNFEGELDDPSENLARTN